MARGSQFIRQWKVLTILTARRYGSTLAELAAEAGVHARTLRRDVEVLEEAGFLLERERDRATGQVKIRLPGNVRAPGIAFNLMEVLAIYFARNLLAVLGGTPMKEGIDTALAKIEATLPVQGLDHVFRARNALAAKRGPCVGYAAHVETIRKVQQAVAERRKVELVYRAYGRSEPARHVVRPYGMPYHDGALYVVGESEQRQAIRVFRVDRIERAALREGRFEVPEKFDLEEFLGEGFGVCHEDRMYDVRIEFGPRNAPWIREREWHPSQRIEEVKGGGLILNMRVAGLQDVLWWVLSFGSGARVLGPGELMERVREEVEGISNAYR